MFLGYGIGPSCPRKISILESPHPKGFWATLGREWRQPRLAPCSVRLAGYGSLPGCEYREGSFCPFAPGVKRLQGVFVNNGLIREEPLGRMLSSNVGPTFRDARAAYASDLERWEPLIEKIVDLFMRVNTRQAEVTATVLFAAQDLKKVYPERRSRSVQVLHEAGLLSSSENVRSPGVLANAVLWY